MSAFASAAFLGFYDIFKKQALDGNAVIPVLFFNTLLSATIFVPFIAASHAGLLADSLLHVPAGTPQQHGCVLLKAIIVNSSWLFGYFGLKHLPITVVGPINATRPVFVLLGAILIFGERLNAWQWTGMLLAIAALFLLSRSSKKEGIDFIHDKWILCVALAAIFGVVSGLYDKFIMKQLEPMFVQAWCNIYLSVIMFAVLMTMWYPKRRNTTPFKWRNSIILVTLFLVVADFLYFSALSQSDSMISVVSMVRRSNVIVSFVLGAVWLREKNVRSKALNLLLILIAMVFLYIGSR